MSKSLNISISSDLTENESPYKFELGKVYAVFTKNSDLCVNAFSGHSNEITFINLPFAKSIKVPSYFNWFNRRRIKREADKLNLLPFQVHQNTLSETFMLVIYSESRKKDVLFIETTGLEEDSITKLFEFALKLINIFSNKLIVFLDYNYSCSNKLWITKIDNAFLEGGFKSNIPVRFKAK